MIVFIQMYYIPMKKIKDNYFVTNGGRIATVNRHIYYDTANLYHLYF